MRVLPAPGLGRGRRGAQDAAAGVPAPRGRRSRLRPAVARQPGAQTRRLGRGRCLLLLPRRNRAAFFRCGEQQASPVTLRSLPKSLDSHSVQERARPPHPVQPPAGESHRLLVEAAASAVLLRLLASRLCSPPPPSLPAPSTAPKPRPQVSAKRLILALSPISALEPRAQRVLFGNPDTLRPKLRGPRASGLGLASTAPHSLGPWESRRPPPTPPAGSELRVAPRSLATHQKKRRACRVPGCPAPSPPPIHKPLRGRVLEFQVAQWKLLFSV